ncbi:HAD family hydrolase [Pelagicoccus mobilis]|uniref:HAD family phosphatase n=1 Tax=Pelagicoccus mobilis TaxID=415221 RepID=A0A934VR17_9BACT|nr:HAD family phosphatase [Pelagicoccus mobilis]MBK1877148.1 HAD family phosphatase [Pelagicoccus mobilis]
MEKEIGFIFDWDGVVVDSSQQHEESWEVVAERNGLPLFEGHFKLGFGKRNELIIPTLLKWSEDPDEIKRLGDEKEAAYREIVRRSGLQPLPGVQAFLESLVKGDMARAVGSSTPRENIDAVTEIIGLSGMFEQVVAAGDVSRGKPDPEVFLKAAERIGRDPANCVVFEDSFSGIEAGLAAGMTVVGIATTNPLSSLLDVGVALAVNSFEEIDLKSLIDTVFRKRSKF